MDGSTVSQNLRSPLVVQRAARLKTMLITGDPAVGSVAEKTGVDRIFVDLEHEGKAERQAGLNAHFSHSTIDDVVAMRDEVSQIELLVRCNPLSKRTAREVDQIMAAGADIIMLPMARSCAESREFLQLVGGRARTCLLVETPQSFARLRNLLSADLLPDEVYLGLNDLTLGLGLAFLFEPLAGGLVDHFCREAANAGLPFGFGGIGAIGRGPVRADLVLSEHVRLGSSMVILSRAFREMALRGTPEGGIDALDTELRKIRAKETEFRACTPEDLERNRRTLMAQVGGVTKDKGDERLGIPDAA